MPIQYDLILRDHFISRTLEPTSRIVIRCHRLDNPGRHIWPTVHDVQDVETFKEKPNWVEFMKVFIDTVP